MATFESSPQVDPGVPLNQLYTYNQNQAAYLANQGAGLANQGTQQALTDAQTVRNNATAIASGDQNATAAALAADPTRAGAVISGVGAQQGLSRTQQAYNLQIAANTAGSILALSPDQQPAAYQAARTMLINSGYHLNLPETFPGSQQLLAFRNFVIPVDKQVELNAGYPRSDGAGPMGYPVGGGNAPPGNAPAQPGGAPQTGQGAPNTPGFTAALINSESGGKSNSINSLGFTGKYQIGTGDLADLGMYTPAPGENLKVNQWAGQLNIPGFPNVKTQADFAANPAAQDAAFQGHISNIDAAIAKTPGAASMDQDGLRAVAHLGGIHGMQQWIATGGKYNPADANGTHLTDYYRKFAGSGAPTQTVPAATPVTQQPLAAPANPAPYQTASTAGTTGMPATANDASLTPTPDTVPRSLGQTESGAQPAATPDAQVYGAGTPLTNALAGLGGGAAGAPPPQNGLMPTATASAQPAPNALAPQPTPQPQPGTPGAPAMAQVAGQTSQAPTYAPPGAHVVSIKGVPMKVEGQPGMAYYDLPNGQRQTFLQPGAPGEPYGRNISIKGPNGETILLDGRGQPIATSAANNQPFMQAAYNRDADALKPIQEAAQAAQTSQIRLHQMRDLVDKFQGGAGGTTRAAMQNYIETIFGPGSLAAQAFAKAITGVNDVAATQEFYKFGLQGAGQDVRNVMGANGGVEAARLFQGANPGLDLVNGANRAIINNKLIGAQADADYAAGAAQHVNGQYDTLNSGKSYVPLANFNQQWQQQRNPQIYAAAMGALNGQPFEKWSNGLKPAEGQRVLQILRKVETPDAQIQWKGGPVTIGGGE